MYWQKYFALTLPFLSVLRIAGISSFHCGGGVAIPACSSKVTSSPFPIYAVSFWYIHSRPHLLLLLLFIWKKFIWLEWTQDPLCLLLMQVLYFLALTFIKGTLNKPRYAWSDSIMTCCANFQIELSGKPIKKTTRILNHKVRSLPIHNKEIFHDYTYFSLFWCIRYFVNLLFLFQNQCSFGGKKFRIVSPRIYLPVCKIEYRQESLSV